MSDRSICPSSTLCLVCALSPSYTCSKACHGMRHACDHRLAGRRCSCPSSWRTPAACSKWSASTRSKPRALTCWSEKRSITHSFLVGIVVLRGMMLVMMPPCVSKPSVDGVMSSSSKSSSASPPWPVKAATCAQGTCAGAPRMRLIRAHGGHGTVQLLWRPNSETRQQGDASQRRDVGTATAALSALAESKGAHLHGGAADNGLVGADACVELLAVEKVLQQLLHLGDARGAAHQHHLVHLQSSRKRGSVPPNRSIASSSSNNTCLTGGPGSCPPWRRGGTSRRGPSSA